MYTGWKNKIEDRKWKWGHNQLHQLGRTIAPSIPFPMFNPIYSPGSWEVTLWSKVVVFTQLLIVNIGNLNEHAHLWLQVSICLIMRRSSISNTNCIRERSFSLLRCTPSGFIVSCWVGSSSVATADGKGGREGREGRTSIYHRRQTV